MSYGTKRGMIYVSLNDREGIHTTFYRIKGTKIKTVKHADYQKGKKAKKTVYKKLFKGYSVRNFWSTY